MTSEVEILYVSIPEPKFQNMADLHEYGLNPYFLNLIRCIQLFDKKNLTIVDCCDKILLNSS